MNVWQRRGMTTGQRGTELHEFQGVPALSPRGLVAEPGRRLGMPLLRVPGLQGDMAGPVD